MEPLIWKGEVTSRFVVANTAQLQLLTVMRAIAELKSRLQRTNPVEAPQEVQPDVLRAGDAGGPEGKDLHTRSIGAAD